MWIECQSYYKLLPAPSVSTPDRVSVSVSLQDPFPKGVIPLTAIEMTRSSKDNKFQVITSQRVFVFRTESEGEGQSSPPTPQGGPEEAM